MAGVFGKRGICAVVAAPTAAEMVRLLRALTTVGEGRVSPPPAASPQPNNAPLFGMVKPSICELRLDWLRNEREIERMIRWLATQRGRSPIGSRVKLILTCRPRIAGGEFRGSVAQQLEILKRAAMAGGGGRGESVVEEARLKRGPYGVRKARGATFRNWIDLEIESAAWMSADEIRALRQCARLLVSYHNFRMTPRDLDGVRRRLEIAGRDAIKIAAHARGLLDALRILRVARSSRRVVAVPMGDAAAPARILALREGSALAYAPVDAATAPGQISFAEMTALYRAEQLTRRTRVYAVIGDPIAHSLSPRLHNAGFQARRMDAVYVPVLVRDLRDFVAAVPELGICGFSVTLPHKEAILKFLDDCDPLAAEIGAVNTVVVRGGGKLYGYNTDYVGVLRALENIQALRTEDYGSKKNSGRVKSPTRNTGAWGTQGVAAHRLSIAGSRVLILGAGGSARAVAFALARGGASVCVCARRLARARGLARAVGGEAIERRLLRGEYFDAIVNATPVGMWPRVSESPLSAAELNCQLVFDLIYRPRETRLLQLAARRGIETVSGLEMFVAQGTAQWEIWTGERAPVAEMMRAVGAGDEIRKMEKGKLKMGIA